MFEYCSIGITIELNWDNVNVSLRECSIVECVMSNEVVTTLDVACLMVEAVDIINSRASPSAEKPIRQSQIK